MYYVNLRIKTVFCSIFYQLHGLFRIGEITKDSQSKAEHFKRLQDITMFPDRMEVCVPSSKTDQLGRGTTVVISSQRDINVCPVKKIEGISIGKGVLFWPTFLSL
jgi:hypothetical protein